MSQNEGNCSLALKMKFWSHLHKALINVTPSELKRDEDNEGQERVIREAFA